LIAGVKDDDSATVTDIDQGKLEPSPPPVKKRKQDEFLSMMKDFMASQQQRHEEESKRQKEMHDQKMELFQTLLSALKDGSKWTYTA
jgi:hypothetical protein